MPLYASAFFLPTSQSIPYILEDLYLRGGYRSVATIADRDAMRNPTRKQGMLVFVREDQTIYWIPGSSVGGVDAWKPFDVTKYVNFAWQEPLALELVDDEYRVSIAPERIVPVATESEANYVLISTVDGPVWAELNALPDVTEASSGMTLILNAEKEPIWGSIQALPPTTDVPVGSSLVLGSQGPVWGAPATRGRSTVEVVFGALIIEGTAQQSAAIPSATLMLLEVTLSHANLRIELHSTSNFNDSNPFAFESTDIKLSDDGVTILEEGAVVRHRRFSFYSELTGTKQIHAKVINLGQESVPEAKVTLNVLPLE